MLRIRAPKFIEFDRNTETSRRIVRFIIEPNESVDQPIKPWKKVGIFEKGIQMIIAENCVIKMTSLKKDGMMAF